MGGVKAMWQWWGGDCAWVAYDSRDVCEENEECRWVPQGELVDIQGVHKLSNGH